MNKKDAQSTMLKWKCQELEALVAQLYGQKQATLLRPSLQSIQWRIWNAKYHSDVARKKMRRSFPRGSTLVDFFKIIFPDEISLKRIKSIKKSRVEICFDVIAAGQAMHSTVDLLAKVIIESFPNAPGYKKIYKTRRNIHEARDLVKQESSDLFQAIEDLVSSDSFGYLQAHTNIIKHQALIDVNYHADCVKGELGFHINQFEYEGRQQKKSFSKKNILDFITDLDEVSKRVIVIGNCINNSLTIKLSENGYSTYANFAHAILGGKSA